MKPSKILIERSELEQVLEALETADESDFWVKQESIVKALRDRLAQPEQSAWNPNDHYNDGFRDGFIAAHPEQERYTAPPQRTWAGSGDLEDSNAYLTTTQRKPLTDEEIEEICWTEVDQRLRSFARGSEAKLKEKNT